VISLDLRSNLSAGKKLNGHEADLEGKSEEEELRYTHILNRVLPPDIRALAWAPVEPDFSARFSCLKRTYRYFFPCADLDVALMHAAAQRYVGTHDFRNLCKMDVANGVVNFQRTILSAGVTWVERGEETGPEDPFRLCQFEVTGQAFLYHQVRCMMAILFLIGQRMESPEIIDELLDVEKNPQKPQYRYGGLGEKPPRLLRGEGLSWMVGLDDLRGLFQPTILRHGSKLPAAFRGGIRQHPVFLALGQTFGGCSPRRLVKTDSVFIGKSGSAEDEAGLGRKDGLTRRRASVFSHCILLGQRWLTPSLLSPSMAVEFPLVLYDCEFANLRWLYDREVQDFNVTHLQRLWADHAVKTQVLRDMLRGLDAAPVAMGTSKGRSGGKTLGWGLRT